MMKRHLLFCVLIAVGFMVVRGAEPRVTDTVLDDIGISEGTAWQLSQPTRESVDRANKVRGSYVRTEVRSTETSQVLDVRLAVTTDDRQPSFMLSLQEEQTITEVRVYETLLRTTVGNDGGRSNYEYHVMPGEYTYGEESVRTQTMPPVPLANAQVTVNGQSYATDENGVVLDPDHRLGILDAMDALDRRTMEFVIEVQGKPAKTYSVFRTMPQRRDFDEKLLDEPAQQDILVCYRLNFKQSLLQPEQEGLEFSLESDAIPAVVRTGECFPLTIKVTNNGSRQTSCLLGRSFSRLDGLNGKLFYFGAVAPGDTARFTRYFKVSPEELVNHLFMEIRFSDSWGILKQTLQLDLPLIH
ncbi:MAG: hypothetical protein IKO65_11125 [Victivallales bacterium]|nr:hypothetical protein [Victivallales bacterium]